MSQTAFYFCDLNLRVWVILFVWLFKVIDTLNWTQVKPHVLYLKLDWWHVGTFVFEFKVNIEFFHKQKRSSDQSIEQQVLCMPWQRSSLIHTYGYPQQYFCVYCRWMHNNWNIICIAIIIVNYLGQSGMRKVIEKQVGLFSAGQRSLQLAHVRPGCRKCWDRHAVAQKQNDILGHIKIQLSRQVLLETKLCLLVPKAGLLLSFIARVRLPLATRTRLGRIIGWKLNGKHVQVGHDWVLLLLLSLFSSRKFHSRWYLSATLESIKVQLNSTSKLHLHVNRNIMGHSRGHLRWICSMQSNSHQWHLHGSGLLH